MFKLFLFSLFFLSLQVFAEEESILKPGAELRINVSFLPEVLAEFNGEKLLSKDFLPTIAYRLNPLSREQVSQQEIKNIIASIIEEKYNREVSLELASLEGVEPNIGLSFLELQKIEKELGRKALTEELLAKGVAYDNAAEYMAESKAIDTWFREKILPENVVNEAEALLYYSENQEKFKEKERVKFAQIYVGYLLPEEKATARRKIAEAHHELNLGKEFAELAQKYSQGNFAKKGGVQNKFYTEDELIDELKPIVEMEVGKVTNVIESRTGFHILKILQKRKAGIPGFDEIKKGLIITMTMEKAKAFMNSKIEQRKKELGVKVFLGN